MQITVERSSDRLVGWRCARRSRVGDAQTGGESAERLAGDGASVVASICRRFASRASLIGVGG